MSETLLFSIGAIVFAITIYGAVMAGGLLLTRIEIDENEDRRRQAEARNEDSSGVPFDVKY